MDIQDHAEIPVVLLVHKELPGLQDMWVQMAPQGPPVLVEILVAPLEPLVLRESPELQGLRESLAQQGM